MLGGPRQGRNYEHRLPAALGILVGVALYAALPSDLSLGSRFIVPSLELVLLVPVLAFNPRRLTRQTPWSRLLSLFGRRHRDRQPRLARSADSCPRRRWRQRQSRTPSGCTADLAHEHHRVRSHLLGTRPRRPGPTRQAGSGRASPADFRFSQDEDGDAIDEVAASSSAQVDWAPVFVDYLYVSVTNSSAFSPTDTMPLSSRAKLLMSIQAISALIVSLLVIAKAVSGLK